MRFIKILGVGPHPYSFGAVIEWTYYLKLKLLLLILIIWD